jgi:phosphatidylglycerol:prolipoprotein diacylglycerol transferase
VLFYKPLYYLAHPLEIVSVWQGGMSFHGGFLGVLVALWFFARSRRKRWLDVTDFVAPLVPLGLAAGRLGNFINGELWGRVTDLPWAMVFPPAGPAPRHPSQLYQFGLEGLALFVLLWVYTRRRRPLGAASGLFLVGYGLTRFVAEYAREPDSFLGYLALGLTMGQWLSLPMIAVGAVMMRWAHRRADKDEPTLLDRMK